MTRKLGMDGPEFSAIGVGCMGMSGMYYPSDRAEIFPACRGSGSA
jgi:aryl-alcohol dehydrogenase-like predicted oxidoreductase